VIEQTAETIALALGGKRVGNHWLAPCPAHEDNNPSLSIRDANEGRVLVHCHAGCDQSDVIGELRSRGLWNSTGDHRRRPARKQPPTAPDAPPAAEWPRSNCQYLRDASAAFGFASDGYSRCELSASARHHSPGSRHNPLPSRPETSERPYLARNACARHPRDRR